MQRGAEEQGIRVLSSGWGGGVSFNGYDYLEQLLLSGRWEKLAAGCRDRGMSLRGLLFDCVLRLACPGLVLDLQRLRRGKGLRS